MIKINEEAIVLSESPLDKKVRWCNFSGHINMNVVLYSVVTDHHSALIEQYLIIIIVGLLPEIQITRGARKTGYWAFGYCFFWYL